MSKRLQDKDRARRTLHVSGYNPKKTSKLLLKELFMQGAPVVEVLYWDSHAFILFSEEESVPYCLALFNEIELHGQRLRLSPRHRTKDTFSYVKYLASIRAKLREQYHKSEAPNLPPKKRKKKNKR